MSSVIQETSFTLQGVIKGRNDFSAANRFLDHINGYIDLETNEFGSERTFVFVYICMIYQYRLSGNQA